MNPFLLLLVGAIEAATLKVEGVGDSVVVFVDGLSQGRTPITLTLTDGRHQLEFKKEEWQTASIRYGLMVEGQTKGKLAVDWATEQVRVTWAEDAARAQQEAKAAVDAQRRAEEDERRAEEEERRAEERARQEAEAARRFAEEEARRQAEQSAREAQEAALRVQYMPHREKGVAAMKVNDRRAALAAFRASVAAGDRDGRIQKLVEKLEGEMGTVRLQLKGLRAGSPPEILLDTPEGDPFAPADKGKGRYEFTDVPAEAALELRIGGVGYQRVVQAVPAVKAGARGDTALTLTWLGTGSLRLTDWPAGAVVTVADQDREHPIEGPGTVAVTTGHVVVSIQAPTGHRKVELDLASGASVELPLKAQLPGTVVLTGLPAGSMLVLLSGPEGAILPAAGVPREDVLREEDGVGLAGPLPLPGLLPGEYTVRVDHPALGQADLRFSPAPGDTREQVVLWQTLSGAAAVQAARLDWERRLAASKQVPKASRLALVGAGGTAVAAGVGALFGARALAARGEFEEADGQYRDALAADDDEAAWDRYAAAMERQDALRANGMVSLAGVGLTAAGAGLTVTLALKGHAAREKVEDWDLYALHAPSAPTPAE